MAESTVSTQADDHLYSPKRKTIRSNYHQIETRINGGKDGIGDVSSKAFIAVMNEVENNHNYVKKPREQVADAEALCRLTSKLVDSVRSYSRRAGVTPTEFVSSLIRRFGHQKGSKLLSENVSWQLIGSSVLSIFMRVSSCKTMIGPMEGELKLRKPVVRAKRARMDKRTRPEELETAVEFATETDRNMHEMFEILKRKRNVEVERLILNKSSFAQTIENLFALSFLVKDGRVHIAVDETGAQIIVPRNGPSAEEISTGVAENEQFMFRLDFNDWELMKEFVSDGEELMPRRDELVL